MLLTSQLFDSGPVVLIHWRLGELCPIEQASANICDLLGISQDELQPGKLRYGEFIHPDDRAAIYSNLAQNLQQGCDQFGRLEYRLISRDNSIKWVEDRTVVQRKPDGTIDYLMGYIIDVTRRKHSEQLHCLNEARFKAITEVMSDWTWEVNADGIYTYCSSQVEKFLGYRASEVIGKSPFDLMPADEVADILATFLDIASKQLPIVDLENWNLHKDGRRVCLLTNGVPIYDEAGNFAGYRGVDKDITQRKQEEDMLLRAHDTALEALRVKNEFLANMSHELRTPLNGICGALELLKGQVGDADQQTLIEVAHNASHSLLTLINNLLNHARLGLGEGVVKTSSLDMRSFVQTLLSEARMLVKHKSLLLEVHVDDSVPAEFMTEPVWLKQVLHNLLSNAIKFTPQGSITLLLHKQPGDKYLHFHVSDTGIGIADAHQKKVFDAFYQVESSSTRSFDGAGLGLAISKQIVERLGGEIWLQSTPGKGTRVSFSHPL